MATEVCFDCAGCGAPPPEGGRHPRCPLCAERKMTSIYFCGRKCQAKCWTEHKAWHVKEDARRADLREWRQVLGRLCSIDQKLYRSLWLRAANWTRAPWQRYACRHSCSRI